MVGYLKSGQFIVSIVTPSFLLFASGIWFGLWLKQARSPVPTSGVPLRVAAAFSRKRRTEDEKSFRARLQRHATHVEGLGTVIATVISVLVALLTLVTTLYKFDEAKQPKQQSTVNTDRQR